MFQVMWRFLANQSTLFELILALKLGHDIGSRALVSHIFYLINTLSRIVRFRVVIEQRRRRRRRYFGRFDVGIVSA